MGARCVAAALYITGGPGASLKSDLRPDMSTSRQLTCWRLVRTEWWGSHDAGSIAGKDSTHPARHPPPGGDRGGTGPPNAEGGGNVSHTVTVTVDKFGPTHLAYSFAIRTWRTGWQGLELLRCRHV
jgi:hypothetical protein